MTACLGISATEGCRFWGRCIETLSTWFPCFRPFVHEAPPPSLHHRVTLGGVANAGNSCAFSVLLQELASEQATYDTFLNTPLVKGNDEEEGHFELRKQLQQNLASAIAKIRLGKRVEKQEIEALASLLQSLGWQGALAPAWRILLCRLAPSIFPLPHPSVYTLYDTVLQLLVETVSEAPSRIVLLGKDPSLSLTRFFEQKEVKGSALYRVALSGKEEKLPEQLQVGTVQLTLKLICAYQDTPYGKHVVLYRRWEEGWVCCNDTVATPVAELPSANIATVVYESRLI